MRISLAIEVRDDRATVTDLNYFGVNDIEGKSVAQIAEITDKTLDAYTAMIDGILAANKEPEQAPAPDIAKCEVAPDSKPEPAPEPEPAKEEKPVTVEEVRKALIEVKKTKGQEGLKACFDAVGSKSLSATDPSQYSALLAKAQEVLNAK